MELLFLPSDAPNLNLIERPWRFIRKRSLNASSQGSFEQFQAAMDRCPESLSTAYQEEIATLLVPKFQTFEDVPMLAA